MKKLNSTMTAESRKWEFSDLQTITFILESDNFIAGAYDSTSLQERIGTALISSNKVTASMPFTLNGEKHLALRSAMRNEIQKNYQLALKSLDVNLSRELKKIDPKSGSIDLSELIKRNFLLSVQELSSINDKLKYDFSELALILDEFQSIRERLSREDRIKSFISDINDVDGDFKAALSLIGVNALIGSVLNSIIHIIDKGEFKNMIKYRHFVKSGLVYIERVCVADTEFLQNKFRCGDKIKLNFFKMMDVDLDHKLLNIPLFANGDSHSCSGMNYSLSAWRCICKNLTDHFADLRLISFTFRENDHIFQVPKTLVVDYVKHG